MNALPHLPEAIVAIRKRNGWSMQAFAAQLSVSHSAISRYESGKIVPSKPVLQHLFALAEGVEKISISRAIGESVIALEGRSNSKSTKAETEKFEPELGLICTQEERQWLLRTLELLRSSRASLLTGMIDSLHQGAILDELGKKRPAQGG